MSYYLEHYWKPLYNQITSQAVANKLFDLGVLFGVGTAVKNLQITFNLEMDGVFGPVTLARVNSSDPTRLLNDFKSEMSAHAKAIAAGNSNEAPDLNGWLRRINS